VTFAPAKLESAIARLEALEDPAARAVAREVVSAVLELHGEGLRRLSSRLHGLGAEGERILRDVLEDEVVASVLLLHGLHPLPIEARVRQALGRVCTSGAGQGERVEVLSADEATVRLRVTSSEDFRRTVTRAVAEAAPEVGRVEILAQDPGLIPVERVLGKRNSSAGSGRGFGEASGHERCELCGQPLASEHDHLFAVERRRLQCACAACSLLFDARGSNVRRVRRQTVDLDGFRVSEAQWAALQVPVGLVFFSYSSALGEVIAAYPGPAGATEAVVPRPAWDALVKDNAALSEIDPDTSALLVNRLSSPPTYHVLPIDACYRLAGIVRSRWQGLTGGDGPMRAIEEFLGGVSGVRS
jgi:hypothetical protein